MEWSAAEQPQLLIHFQWHDLANNDGRSTVRDEAALGLARDAPIYLASQEQGRLVLPYAAGRGNTVDDLALVFETNRVRRFAPANEPTHKLGVSTMYEFGEQDVIVNLITLDVVEEWLVCFDDRDLVCK